MIASRRFLFAAVAFLASVAFYAPAFLALDATGFGDWQMIHHNWEVGFVALTRFAEWPLFDPYHCGGVTMLGNPESQHFSPLYALAFLTNPTLGAKLFIAFHGMAAFLGAYAYGRVVLLVSRPASLFLAVVFAFSGFFAQQIGTGHVTFVPFAFLPTLLLSWRRAEDDVRYAVVVAFLLALTIAEGGTYPLPYMMVPLAIATIVRLLANPDALRRVTRASLVTVPLAGLVAAVRIVPILATLRRFPRTIVSLDRSTLADVLEMLTARTHSWGFLGHEFVWPEYGAYVGYGVLGLAAIGASRAAFFRRSSAATTALVGAVVSCWLVLGNVGPFHPWPLLRHLPVYDSLRVPSRFLVVLVFHLAALGALAIDGAALPHARPKVRRVLRTAALAALFLVTLDLVIVTRPSVDNWWGAPIDATGRATSFRLVPVPNYDAVYASLPRQHRGTALCYVGGMEWRVAPGLWWDGGKYARVVRGAGSVASSDRTTNTLSARAILTTPSRVVFDQNFDPDFVTNEGHLVDDAGMLAVDLPAGAHSLFLRYAPAYLLPSLAASLLGLVLAVCILLRARGYRL